eukprot:CAMPEP_0178449772 /NCGR_PEP_ID=MMETSP0689_2-20121128/42749_1 /TAXON_ID=160604 /ORGANISM="Amphidinium massartii, Strain CS-259" /LENGTH=54 /DNA_ID=CAMNT_0020075153 /DNA_START=106 /DNA_END=266 /DNA_ORIENTATION=-
MDWQPLPPDVDESTGDPVDVRLLLREHSAMMDGAMQQLSRKMESSWQSSFAAWR